MLEALTATNEHPTAEMLYKALKRDYPELSLGTVYRNLAVLREDGLAVSVAHVDGQERYDARTDPHAHFICRRCGRVLDIELPGGIGSLAGELSQGLGCSVESVALSASGVCAECSRE